MGVLVYWLIVAAVIVLGLLMPQQGKKKKYYIIVMAVLHIFVCGFRYMYLTGDLRKYAWEYSTMSDYGWFSNNVFHGGRNAGFYWLMKLVCDLTNGDFQIFLIVLAVITQVIVAVLIYRYSPKPWLSYLVWNCMAFYVIYDFSAIKQGLVMSVLMCAMMCIFVTVKRLNPKKHPAVYTAGTNQYTPSRTSSQALVIILLNSAESTS